MLRTQNMVWVAFALMMLVCNCEIPPAVDGSKGEGTRVETLSSMDVRQSIETNGREEKVVPEVRTIDTDVSETRASDAGSAETRGVDAGRTETDVSDAKGTMELLLDTDAPPDAATSDAKGTMDVMLDTYTKPDLGTGEKIVDSNPSPSCLPVGYTAYFASHPHVFVATFGRLNAAGQTYFCKDLHELENKSRITIAEPAASAGCIEPKNCTYITPTPDEKIQILAAKYAHSIWLDRHKKVSWSLSNYSSSDLDGLFDPMVLFRNGTHFMSVVDHSPTQAWTYLSGRKLVRTDPKSSMVAVLDDLRTTDTKTEFVHGIGTGSQPDPVNTAYTLEEALRTRVTKVGGVTMRISRRGCHSMSRILLALLRAMNIPGKEVHSGQWYGTGHSTPHWPGLGLVIPHGDDLYQATLRTTPTRALLAPESFYTDKTNTAVCGTDRGCLGRRYASLNTIAYPAQYTTQRCCKPKNYGYTSCHNYLTANYAATLTSAEIASTASSIQANCPPP